MGPNFVAVLGN